jgi:hypothetical protein
MKKGDVQPPLDRPLVHRDLLQPFEKWFWKDVIEDVDLEHS